MKTMGSSRGLNMGPQKREASALLTALQGISTSNVGADLSLYRYINDLC